MLVLAACGARLTREQKLAGIGSLGGGTGGATTGETTGATTGTAATTTGATTGSAATTGASTGAATTTGAAASACGNPATNPASDTGVTKNQITVATASDVNGVQAALFKSTHDAMRAFTTMINSQGGVCGRTLKFLPLDTRADTT